MKPKKLVFGVGINDADYVVQRKETIGYVGGKRKRKLIWYCRYYSAWEHMLARCYSARWQEKYPTYAGCAVATEWLTFSNFKAWMEKQNWKGGQLDKDLLFEGNKLYSAETCVFVTQALNKFANERGNDRGEWLLGVNLDKRRCKFQAR